MFECNRKTFIAGLFSAIAVASVASVIDENKNCMLSDYYRRMAERYVDTTITCTRVLDSAGHYRWRYYVAPIGFVYDPDNESRTMVIEVPFKYRGIYTNKKYDNAIREELITKLQTFLAEQHIYEKLNGIKL